MDETFESKKKNILPTFLILAVFFAVPFGLLLAATNFQPLVIIFVVPSFLIFYIYARKLFVPSKIKVRAEEIGLTVYVNNQTVNIAWDEINGIKFFSRGAGVTILPGKLARYWGFYQLETGKGKIDLPATLENMETLLRIIIKKCSLKKHYPTFKESLLRDPLASRMSAADYPFWKREGGYAVQEADLNINVGGLSGSAVQLFIVLSIVSVIVFLICLYLTQKGII